MAVLKPFAKPSWVENDSGVLMPSRRAIFLKSSDASVGLTFTDLDNGADPAGVGSTEIDLSASGGGGSLSVTDGATTVDPATEIDFTSGATVTNLGSGKAGVAITGGGGGGLQIGELGWNEQAPDARTVINAGDTDHQTSTTITGPPDFLDGSGFIQTFGIYAAYLAIKVLSAGAAGQVMYISSPFNMGIPIALDSFTGHTDPDYAYNTPPDVVCLANNGDLNAVGFGNGAFAWFCSIPAGAAGWSLSVLPFLLQVAHV